MKELTKQQEPQAIAVLNNVMTQAGQAANEAVSSSITSPFGVEIQRKNPFVSRERNAIKYTR